MRNDATVHGAAPNVDLSGKRDVEAAADRNRRRIFDVTCLTCGHTERVRVEPGDDRTVDHDRQNATHWVEYHEVGR
jgi:cytochrome c5